eukprot:gb/GECG01003502.1/.p1 GENE.gb/GECG01003502.1/~~gb/GECG01003502.1/.p1  ORF type:complete len:491 (+),score=72.21 gb/GECG01003502.1/:1-1473(+)
MAWRQIDIMEEEWNNIPEQHKEPLRQAIQMGAFNVVRMNIPILDEYNQRVWFLEERDGTQRPQKGSGYERCMVCYSTRQRALHFVCNSPGNCPGVNGQNQKASICSDPVCLDTAKLSFEYNCPRCSRKCCCVPRSGETDWSHKHRDDVVCPCHMKNNKFDSDGVVGLPYTPKGNLISGHPKNQNSGQPAPGRARQNGSDQDHVQRLSEGLYELDMRQQGLEGELFRVREESQETRNWTRELGHNVEQVRGDVDNVKSVADASFSKLQESVSENDVGIRDCQQSVQRVGSVVAQQGEQLHRIRELIASVDLPKKRASRSEIRHHIQQIICEGPTKEAMAKLPRFRLDGDTLGAKIMAQLQMVEEERKYSDDFYELKKYVGKAAADLVRLTTDVIPDFLEEEKVKLAKELAIRSMYVGGEYGEQSLLSVLASANQLAQLVGCGPVPELDYFADTQAFQDVYNGRVEAEAHDEGNDDLAASDLQPASFVQENG